MQTWLRIANIVILDGKAKSGLGGLRHVVQVKEQEQLPGEPLPLFVRGASGERFFRKETRGPIQEHTRFGEGLFLILHFHQDPLRLYYRLALEDGVIDGTLDLGAVASRFLLPIGAGT